MNNTFNGDFFTFW